MKKVVKRKNRKYNLFMLITIIVIGLFIEEIILYSIEIAYETENIIILDNGGKTKSLYSLKIENPIPNGSIVSFFAGENKTFYISDKSYEKTLWYLDGKNVNNNSNSIELVGLPAGNHTLEIRVYNGSESNSRIWNVIVEGPEIQRTFVFDTGFVMFWVIIIILIIIMFLVVWLIIIEKAKNKSFKEEYLRNFRGPGNFN
jgi:hypothetical protein